MQSNYNINGLVTWNEDEIEARNFFLKQITLKVKELLLESNKSWSFARIESPLLTPSELINPNYTDEDVYRVSPTLTLRPETTIGSYEYARKIVEDKINILPMVVYQSGKSFRQEQNQTLKNVRLKEFYQLEFQCLYSEGTLNDYQNLVTEPLAVLVKKLLGKAVRVVESDRLPSYSKKTMDIEVETPHKWLEVCSISVRNDFTTPAKFHTKAGITQKSVEVLEIAFGLDRLVSIWNEGH